ncbi:MAG: acyl-CoA synthetase, partial [Gammaproteobacteria bacterium]|nr:acyl-CoA synthetase [Gammaproteobacteria bacterium]
MANRDRWQWTIPEYFNIGTACTDAHLESAAATRVAMIVEDDQAGVSSATYSQLARQSSQFAQLLRNHGASVGDRVLIRLPNSLEFPTAFLGTMKSGAIAVPTSTLLVAEEVRYLAQDSGAAFMVTHKSMWPELKAQLNDLQDLDHVFLAGDGPMPETETRLALHDLSLQLAQIAHCS